jgi:hypothetical protein
VASSDRTACIQFNKTAKPTNHSDLPDTLEGSRGPKMDLFVDFWGQ